MMPYLSERPKRLTRAERVQKIAHVLREFEDARRLWDDMTRIKFALCIKVPPDELADAKAIVYGEQINGDRRPNGDGVRLQPGGENDFSPSA